MLQKQRLDQALGLLAQFLADSKYSAHIIICGGAALSIMEVVSRPTKDVDVLALIGDGGRLTDAKPLPEAIQDAANRVAETLGLPLGWLNDGPASQIRFGFPIGMQDRLVPRRYGDFLTVYLIGRLDQIHLKLFAAADQGRGRHTDDLLALQPTEEEIEIAARWVAGQDASEVFAELLKDMLAQLGYANVASRL